MQLSSDRGRWPTAARTNRDPGAAESVGDGLCVDSGLVGGVGE